MAGAGDYHRLRHLVLPVEAPDLLRHLEPIHNGHTQIGQYQPVNVTAVIQRIFDLGQRLQAIVCAVHDVCQAWDVQSVDRELHCQNIVRLIINEQDPLVRRNCLLQFEHGIDKRSSRERIIVRNIDLIFLENALGILAFVFLPVDILVFGDLFQRLILLT